jgi:vesicle-associated membrane protein 7
MPIVYALISRKKDVMAEYTASSGNFPTVTRVLLSKIPDTDSKMSYVYDAHVFHYIVDQGITFLCMADESTKRRITFAFLEDIKQLWREKYGGVEQTALAFSLNDSFSPILKQRIDFFNVNPAADNIGRVQAQIDTVKDAMVENIEKVLERGEKIELLVDKTDRLNQQAFKFERQSRTLQRDMMWRKYRNYCLILLIVSIIIIFIILMACGIKLDRCKKSS